MKHEKTYEAIGKLRDIEDELHRLKNAFEMALEMALDAKRPWVGLTDEEVGMLTVFDGLHHVEIPLLANFARAIEAKLKEKNTWT